MSASRVSRFTRCKLLYVGFPFLTALVAMLTLGPAAHAQDRPSYIVGEPQGLEMLVHIVGEVQRPGEYRVRDRTNLLELFSKAGGPTEFSKMSQVTIRRAPMFSVATDSLKGFGSPQPIGIVVVNLKEALVEPDAALPPTLRPGDVVYVPKGRYHRASFGGQGMATRLAINGYPDGLHNYQTPE